MALPHTQQQPSSLRLLGSTRAQDPFSLRMQVGLGSVDRDTGYVSRRLPCNGQAVTALRPYPFRRKRREHWTQIRGWKERRRSTSRLEVLGNALEIFAKPGRADHVEWRLLSRLAGSCLRSP